MKANPPRILFKSIEWLVDVAVNWNHTSSPLAQVLIWEDGVAPIKDPLVTEAQLWSGFVEATIAPEHSSFGIKVQNDEGPAHKLESVALQTALT